MTVKLIYCTVVGPGAQIAVRILTRLLEKRVTILASLNARNVSPATWHYRNTEWSAVLVSLAVYVTVCVVYQLKSLRRTDGEKRF